MRATQKVYFLGLLIYATHGLSQNAEKKLEELQKES